MDHYNSSYLFIGHVMFIPAWLLILIIGWLVFRGFLNWLNERDREYIQSLIGDDDETPWNLGI